MKGNAGFTLIETVISIMLLSFISLFTVQSIQRALQTKAKMQTSIDKNATLRDALKVMERDINMAFNYRDVGIELYNQAQDERKKAAAATQNQTGGAVQRDANGNVINTAGGVATPGSPLVQTSPDSFKHKVDKILTHFIGEAESLNFTSLSNVRMTEDSKVCSQAEVGYKLQGCRRRSTQEQSSKCLWRRVSNYIHEDITREGDQTVLLENVTDFKLRYLGPGKEQEWVDTWITNERGDGTTQGKFPYAVEITIEVTESSGPAKGKKLRMTAVASIRNPNNPKSTNPDGTPSDLPAAGNPNQNQSQGQQSGAGAQTPGGSTAPGGAGGTTGGGNAGQSN